MTPEKRSGEDRRICGDRECLVERLESQMALMLKELKESQDKYLALVREDMNARMEEMKVHIIEMKDEKRDSHKSILHRIETLELGMDRRIEAGIEKWHTKDEIYLAMKRKHEGNWAIRTGIAITLAAPILYLIYKLITHVEVPH